MPKKQNSPHSDRCENYWLRNREVWESLPEMQAVDREVRARMDLGEQRESYLDCYLRKLTAAIGISVSNGTITAFRGDRILAARTVEANELKRLRGEQPYVCSYNQTTAVEMRLSA